MSYKERYSDPLGYVLVYRPNHPNSQSSGYIHERVLRAADALGKPLPQTVRIFRLDLHNDNDRTALDNLVVCPNLGYERLLFRRWVAYQACGHADYRQCYYCHRYDDPDQMVSHRRAHLHRQCRIEHRAGLRIKKKQIT